MAYSHIIWPGSLPKCSQVNGYSPTISSNTVRTEMDSGASRQRSRGNIIVEPVNLTFFIDSKQLGIMRDFFHTTGGRSFWIPFPDPYDARYEDGKYRCARIKASSNDSIASPETIRPGFFRVNLVVEYWRMVPAKTIDEIAAL